MIRRLLLIALLLVLAAPAMAQGAFEKALKAYRAAIDRPPLARRMGGMRALARTRDVRAIRILAARYSKPRVPKDHERYLIARMCGEFFTGPEHVTPLHDFTKRHRKDADGWLWFQGLHAAARQPDVAPVLAIIENDRTNPFVRAGAIETLADEGRMELLPLIPRLLGEKLPKKGMPRTLLIESSAAGLLAHKAARGTPGFRAAAETLVALLANKDVRERAKLTIARHLARALDSRKVTLDPAWWMAILSRNSTGESAKSRSVAYPRFMGLEATGRRVVYLIDLSDSMMNPLTGAELDLARAVPLAGETGFPWTKVKNRFDFAREHLRRSLLALESDVRFAIIGFGDEAEPFRSTKALIPATRKNVVTAIRELDDIEARKSTDGKKRPYGVLRGDTNLHGALLKAFQMTSRGRVTENEHVDEGTFRDGADTIFLLSDGKPTRDDFFALDMAEPGRSTTDAETGETKPANFRRSANFFGPYRNPDNLLADLRRMNLFRKAEIHTISMGDADLFLMHRIAMLGLGKYRNLGGNGVLVLNGSSALEIDLPKKPDILTLECWANGPKPRGDSSLVSDTQGAGFGLFLRFHDVVMPCAAVRDGKKYLRVQVGAEWRWKRWNHLAMTFDGECLRFFVNGKLIGEEKGGKLRQSKLPLIVGAEPTGKGDPRWFFRGAMDEIRLSNFVRYEEAFTPAKVLERDSNTLLLLQFDGDGETPFSDSSPHHHPVKTHGRPRVRSESR